MNVQFIAQILGERRFATSVVIVYF